LSLIKLSFLVFSFKLYITQLFNFNSNFIFETFKRSSYSSSSISSPKTNTYTLDQQSYFTSETLLLTKSLSKATYSINQLRDSKHFQNFLFRLKSKLRHRLSFLFSKLLILTMQKT
jgi:hypothetical protein